MVAAIADPTTQYASDVVAGCVVVGHLVKLACQRHLRDLEEGPARGLRWDLTAANRALKFFSLLRHGDGAFAGEPFNLLPFQQFIIGSVFGWKAEDGWRRFRVSYCEMGKGNGKSPVAGGVGLYGLTGDGEGGAEIYSAATTREQAGILFRDAKRMAEKSPTLSKLLEIGLHNIAYDRTDSYFRPVSSEHRGLDGKRPHIALIDELHEHPTALVTDKMRSGTKGRRQALIFEITNSGHDRMSVCWAHHEYSRKVLEGTIENDSWFAYVCTLDPCQKHRTEGKRQPENGCSECDDWRDKKVWPKANPGLGVIITEKYLSEQVEEAKGMPTKEGIVRRLNFCQWTESRTGLIPVELWSTGNAPVDVASLAGRRCWGGLDLSNRYDLTALALIFPWEGDEEGFDLLAFMWIPRDIAKAREDKDRVPYFLWEQQGLIRFTEGDVTDYNVVEEQIKELHSIYQIEEIGYDPTNCTQMATSLNAYGIEMIQFNQNMTNFHEPTEGVLRLLKEGKLRHGDDGCLAWQASNTDGLTDAANRVRPVKPARQDGRKIDAIVALIMGYGRAMLRDPEGSVYDRGGVKTVGGPAPAPPELTEADFRAMFGDDPDDDD